MRTTCRGDYLDFNDRRLLSTVGDLDHPKLVTATPDHPVRRAGLTGAFVIGLAMTRYVLVNPPVANLSREELCRWARR